MSIFYMYYSKIHSIMLINAIFTTKYNSGFLISFSCDRLEDLPEVIVSTNNILIIYFRSDDKKTYKGFMGEYEFIKASKYFCLYLSNDVKIIAFLSVSLRNYVFQYKHNIVVLKRMNHIENIQIYTSQTIVLDTIERH